MICPPLYQAIRRIHQIGEIFGRYLVMRPDIHAIRPERPFGTDDTQLEQTSADHI